ncbi:hypothetical protein [Leifsonia sp. NPDC080035]|uniref:Membrane protein YmcC n=1 Tax=Leifsonia sp. NPDC080035 TaxID=3143936 RepID=A0AAU7GER8_9MICO
MLIVVVVACEVLFWVFLALGLSARYLLRRPRLGAVLLALSPAADLVLLTATALDLRAGATATFAHGLAAIYLGFSVAYGRALIRWADVRFAHRFAGGDAPRKKFGAAYTKACWLHVGRSLLAVAITAAVLGLLWVLAGDPSRTQALLDAGRIAGIILLIDTLWAVSYTVWPRREPRY